MRPALLALLGAGAGAVALGWWTSPPPTAPGLGGFLPRGSTVVSQARVDLDGVSPVEVAGTAYVAASPAGGLASPQGIILRYDRWRRRWAVALTRPLPGLPVSVAAGPLFGRRDAIVLSSYAEDGTMPYTVIAAGRWGGFTVRHEGRAARRVEVAGNLLVERGAGSGSDRAFRWDGRRFVAAPAPAPPPPHVVWRYWIRRGAVGASADRVLLVPGQVLRVVRNGGGPTVAVAPDTSLDQVEAGLRARRPGMYAVTVGTGVLGRPPFRLTVEVREPPATTTGTTPHSR